MSEAARIREIAAVSGPRVVTSAHAGASAAGIGAYARGGNAFDAALAACFFETVALPMKCGLAGDVVGLFRVAGGTLQSLVSVGAGPAALAEGATLERVGPRSVGIPGAPSGYAALHGFARLDLGALIGPAVRAASDGVPWNRVSLSYLQEAQPLLEEHDSAAPYMPGGRMPSIGDVRRLPGLGGLLQRFARYGAALFEHEDGDRLLARLETLGGILRPEDFRQRPARIAASVRVAVGDVWLHATPSPSGGPRLQAIVAQAMGAGAALLDVLRAERVTAKAAGRMALDGGTSVVTAADDQGNAVLVVHSNSFPRFGAGVTLDDGLVLNNRPGRGFDLGAPPGSANAPRAGRTPQTTLHAWALERPEDWVLGATPGGINQLPWNAQMVTELLRGGAVADAVCNPRWALDEQDRLTVEPGAAVPSDAGGRGVAPLSHRSAQQVLHVPQSGLILAAADPRVAACALAAY